MYVNPISTKDESSVPLLETDASRYFHRRRPESGGRWTGDSIIAAWYEVKKRRRLRGSHKQFQVKEAGIHLYFLAQIVS